MTIQAAPTTETDAATGVRPRIVRSAATIALYAVAGPLFGAGFMLALWDAPSLSRLAEAIALAFIAAPVVGLFAYPVGLLPALMTGCLSALLSPVMPSTLKYAAASTAIGALTTALLLAAFGVGGNRFLQIAGAGAVAALCCALISNLFRFRPPA
jgi:hypothetical protein